MGKQTETGMEGYSVGQRRIWVVFSGEYDEESAGPLSRGGEEGYRGSEQGYDSGDLFG